MSRFRGATSSLSTRQRIVNAANGALHARSHFIYAEVRPIPIPTFVDLMNGKNVTVKTDCSGLATCCYFRAGAPDPNGQGYDTTKTMYTGTMLAHLPAIPLSKAQPGDLAVFGAFPGKHVIIIVGTGSDPMCVSHGTPGDPKEAPLSHFASIGVLTVLRGVPVVPIPKPQPTPVPVKPARKATWIVSGDGGRVLGRVRRPYTRRTWGLTHRRLLANQKEAEHFDRIHPAPAGATNVAIHFDEQ